MHILTELINSKTNIRVVYTYHWREPIILWYDRESEIGESLVEASTLVKKLSAIRIEKCVVLRSQPFEITHSHTCNEPEEDSILVPTHPYPTNTVVFQDLWVLISYSHYEYHFLLSSITTSNHYIEHTLIKNTTPFKDVFMKIQSSNSDFVKHKLWIRKLLALSNQAWRSCFRL